MDTPSNGPTEPTLPIRDIPRFLEEVEKLFDNIVHHWDQILFPVVFRSLLKSAWDEVKGGMWHLNNWVRNAGEPELINVGLGGEQLRLKLAALNDAWHRFRRSGTAKLLKELLFWINKILGSLAAATPTPLAEPLKELKEAIERLITSDEEVTRLSEPVITSP